jgi:hypothetical protein
VELFFPDYLIDLLIISMSVSVVLMALIQKFKTLTFINKIWQVWLLNLLLSFALGVPFAMSFYNLNWIDGIWVSVFSFIGAPTLYDALKNQNIINYKPISLSDNISANINVSIENEIKRDE